MRREGHRATRRTAIALLSALLAGAASGSSTDDGDARALVKRVLDAMPDMPFTATMTLATEGGARRDLALSHKRIGDTRASYLEVTSPLNVKDTRFLFLERVEGRDEQFVYVPAVKRVAQIGEDARQQPFLGSEFYVSDLVRPALDEFAYAAVGEAAVGGRQCALVEATPKSPMQHLYGKTVFAIDARDLVIVRLEFFDRKGRPLKVWTVERLERIDGVWTAREQRMTNLQEKVSSRLVIDAIRYHAEVPDERFTRAYLAR